MGLGDITRNAVLQAIAEYDELGHDRFIKAYGYKSTRSHALVHQGREYDARATCGVAHEFMTGLALPLSALTSGTLAFDKHLRSLGFEVRPTRNPNWEWDELILACDLLERLGWKWVHPSNAEVRELSALLHALPIHPPEVRSATFRNPAGVVRKMQDIATTHPDYAGKRTKGGRLDGKVLRAFLDEPERMRAAARSIRDGVRSGEFDGLAPLEEEEPDEEVSALEGRLLLRKHYARERSRKLRNQKIAQVRDKKLPIACEACGFDFAERYGDRGRDYIEVHHTVPLHVIGPSRTRLQDLALLCANCHRMIHVSEPWLTVEQLRALVENRSEHR